VILKGPNRQLRADRWMDEWMDRQMCGWMNGWVDRWVGEWLGELKGGAGWMEMVRLLRYYEVKVNQYIVLYDKFWE